MQAPESLGHVAVPADGAVALKNIHQFLRMDLFPLDRNVIWPQQCGHMIDVMKRADLFVAKHATLPFIPLRNDIPDEAVLGINLDLLQAFLAAVLTFRPA